MFSTINRRRCVSSPTSYDAENPLRAVTSSLRREIAMQLTQRFLGATGCTGAFSLRRKWECWLLLPVLAGAQNQRIQTAQLKWTSRCNTLVFCSGRGSSGAMSVLQIGPMNATFITDLTGLDLTSLREHKSQFNCLSAQCALVAVS